MWTALVVLIAAVVVVFFAGEYLRARNSEREREATKAYVATLTIAISQTRMHGTPVWCRFPSEVSRKILEASEFIEDVGPAEDLPEDVFETQRVVGQVVGKYTDLVQRKQYALQAYDREAKAIAKALAIALDGIDDPNVFTRRRPLASSLERAHEKCAELLRAAMRLGFNTHPVS